MMIELRMAVPTEEKEEKNNDDDDDDEKKKKEKKTKARWEHPLEPVLISHTFFIPHEAIDQHQQQREKLQQQQQQPTSIERNQKDAHIFRHYLLGGLTLACKITPWRWPRREVAS
ncbi:hypothetical protein PV325_012967 [Microctonus aethiopoides]|nr:hypothetical protein PV325_012967 [Microctonus aethiopoides]